MRHAKLITSTVVLVLMIALPSPAFAQGVPEILARLVALEARVTSLETDVTALQTRVGTLEGQVSALQSQLAAETAARQAADTTLQTNIDAEAQARQSADATLQAQIDALGTNALASYVSVSLDPINGLPGPHVIVTGTNVHIRSGTGRTDDGGFTPAGLGNLVIGVSRPAIGVARTTSSSALSTGSRARAAWWRALRT